MDKNIKTSKSFTIVRKNKKDSEIDEIKEYFKNNDTTKNENKLLEEIKALYGKEYDYSNISNIQLQEMYDDAINRFKNNLPIKKAEDYSLDILIENKKEKNKTDKKTIKEKQKYQWNSKYNYPNEKDFDNIIIEIDISGCPDIVKEKIKILVSKYFSQFNDNFKINVTNFDKDQIAFMLLGDNAYNAFRFENGIHVFKIDNFISNVKINITPIGLNEEKDIKISEKEVKIDTFKASGAGGQHINKTSSAVRITHVPTNISVVCQKERLQIANKMLAYKILQEKIINFENNKANDLANNILKDIYSDEKIRTYDFNNNKLIDHRINYKIPLNNFNKINFSDIYNIINKYNELKNEITK